MSNATSSFLGRVHAGAGDEVAVLDISLDKNRSELIRLLDAGATVRYFDHHHAGDVPKHSRFEPHLDESPAVCTSVLVDRYLGGRHRVWAIVAAFGDNMPELGQAMARAAGMDAATIATLEQLGVRLLAGEAPGSKLEKARELGIEVIDEAELKRGTGA